MMTADTMNPGMNPGGNPVEKPSYGEPCNTGDIQYGLPAEQPQPAVPVKPPDCTISIDHQLPSVYQPHHSSSNRQTSLLVQNHAKCLNKQNVCIFAYRKICILMLDIYTVCGIEFCFRQFQETGVVRTDNLPF